MAAVAHGFSVLEVGPRAVPGLARERSVGAGRQGTTGTRPEGVGTKCYTQRGDCRFAVGQNGAKRGRRGYDAGKKIKGRKRHIAVDTQDNLLAVIVHSAGIQDRVAARAALC